jgi:type IV pilus assembly protein PilN
MIRINLLPVRAAKKKESTRFQLTVAGLVTFLVLAVSFAVYLTVSSEANAIKGEIEQGNEELLQLKRKIGELSKIKEQKRVVEEKLNIVKNLEAARTGPAELFKMVAISIPEKAWLKSLKDEGQVITIRGFAADDEVVAEFMRRLQRHKGPGGVELEVVESIREAETKAEVVRFVIRLGK